MDFRDLLDTLRRFWRIAALVAVVVIGLGAIAAFVPQKEYRTSATIILEFAPDTEVSIQQVNFLIPGIEEQARSRTLRDNASVRVSEQFQNPAAIITATADASVVRVFANTTSPRGAQEWADAVALELIDQRNSGSGPLEFALLDPAQLRRKPVAPDVMPIMLAAIVVGLISAVFAALLASRLVGALRGGDPSGADVSPAERSRMMWRGVDPFDRVVSRSDHDDLDIGHADDEPPAERVDDVPPSESADDQAAAEGEGSDPDLAAEPEWAKPQHDGATEEQLARSSARRPLFRLAAPMFIAGGIVAAGLLIVR